MKKTTALLVVAVLIGASLAAWAFVALDPLRQLYTVTDHGIQFKGGQLNGALLNFIQKGPQAPNYTRYEMVGGGGTASFKALDFKMPAYRPPEFAAPRLGLFDGPPPDLLGWFFSLFIQPARAASCTAGSGDCWYVGGASGDFTTGSNWSLTEGGAAGTVAPTSGNNIRFGTDASCACTLTLGADFSTTGTMTLNSHAVDIRVTGAHALTTGAVTITLNILSVNTTSWTLPSLTMSGTAGLASTGSTWTINGNVSVTGAGAVAVNVTSTTTVTGSWTNTAASGNWSSGTWNVTFLSTSNQTITPGPSGLLSLNAEFGNCIFDTTLASGTVAYTLSTNKLTCGSTLTVRDTAASTSVTLNTSASNIGINAGAVTIAAKGAVASNSSLITVNGNWDSSAGDFTVGYTATVEFTFSGNLTTVNSAGGGTFWNLTIDASRTATATNSIGISNVLTVNGTYTFSASGKTLFILNNNGVVGPLVLGGSGAVTGLAGEDNLQFFNVTGSQVNIPGGTYANMAFIFEPNNVVADPGLQFQLQGTLSASRLQFVILAANKPGYFNSQTFGVTLTSTTTAGILASGTGKNGISATSGSWSISSSVDLSAGTSIYVKFGSSTWTVAGTWTNASTDGADWSAGTGGVTFTSATSRTITLGNLGVSEFNNVTFDPSSGSATPVWTAASNPLLWSGALTVQDTTVGGTATLDVSTNSINLTGGSLTVGNRGTLTANAVAVSVTGVTMTGGTSGTITVTSGAWTVSGNWDTSGVGSTYTQGTSTVTFAATGTLKTVASAGNATFYNVVVNSSVVTTGQSDIGIEAALTVNGTWTKSAAGNTFLRSPGTPLVLGASASLGIWTIVFFTQSGSLVNVPGHATAWTNATIRMEANLTVAGLGYEYRLSGTMGALGTIEFVTLAGNPQFFNSQTFNVTVATIQEVVSDVSTAHGIQATSGTWSVGTFNSNVLGGVALYIKFGSSVWSVTGAWTNISTSANWNAGTSTVSFVSTSNQTMTFAGAGIPGGEFYNLTIDTTNATNNPGVVVVRYSAATDLIVSNTLSIQDTGGNAAVALDTSGAAHNITTVSVVLAGSGPGLGFLYTNGANVKTTNWTSTQSGYSPDCFRSGTITSCTTNDVVEFYGSGTVTGKNSIAASDFWNVVIDSSAVVTYNTLIATDGIMTIAGTLQGTGTCINQEWAIFGFGNNPNVLTLNPGYNLANGLLFFDLSGALTAYNIPAGTSSMMYSIYMGSTSTVTMLGDVTLLNSSPGGSDFNCGELLIATRGAASTGIFDTAGHNLTVGGTFFIGDMPTNTAVVFHSRSSHIIAREAVNPRYGGSLQFETSTWDMYPSPVYDPVAFYPEFGAVMNGGTATINIHGKVRFWPDATTMVQDFNVQGATVNVLAGSGSVSAFGTPGDVSIDIVYAFIDFGTSTWNIAGSWTNISTSASWSATTGTVNFTGSGTITVASLTGGIALPEFPTVNIAVGASYTVASTKSMTFVSANVNGQLIVTDGGSGTNAVTGLTFTTDTGYITFNNVQAFVTGDHPNVTFTITISNSGAKFTFTVDNIQAKVGVYKDGDFVANVTPSGIIMTSQVAGPWSTHIIHVGATTTLPGGCTGTDCSSPTAPDIKCDYTYGLLSVTLNCSTDLLVQDANSLTWYVDGQAVAHGTVMQTTVLVLGVSRTITVEMVITGFTAVDESMQLQVTANQNIIFYAVLIVIITLGVWGIVRVKAKKQVKKKKVVFQARTPPPMMNGRRPPLNGNGGYR